MTTNKEIKDEEIFAGLTPKQRLFLEHYVANGYNASEAVIKAGYKTNIENSRKMGYELLQKPHIKNALENYSKHIEKSTTVKPEYVLRKLVQTVERTEDRNDNAHLRALELLAKHLGMFVERTEISGPDGKAIEMEQKVKEDVADFTSAIARLASRGGKGRVPKEVES